MTHWNAKESARLATISAWIGDCIYSELLVRAHKLSPQKKYRAAPNSAYDVLGAHLTLSTVDYSSRNNIGYVLEHLMWVAVEENLCIFAVAIQH